MHRPYGCGGFYVAVIRRGRVLFLCGGRHRGRPGDASRVTIAESYRTGVPLRSSAVEGTEGSALRVWGVVCRGKAEGTGAVAVGGAASGSGGRSVEGGGAGMV